MTTPSTPGQATELCHCGHPEDLHDAVALRFCQATLNGVLRRGCACRLEAPDLPRSYDRR